MNMLYELHEYDESIEAVEQIRQWARDYNWEDTTFEGTDAEELSTNAADLELEAARRAPIQDEDEEFYLDDDGREDELERAKQACDLLRRELQEVLEHRHPELAA